MLPSAVCKHCGEEKPYEDLRKYGPGKVRRECNACYKHIRKERDYDRGWYQAKLAAQREATVRDRLYLAQAAEQAAKAAVAKDDVITTLMARMDAIEKLLEKSDARD